ncbi:hypothetical protein DL93DRAFT_2026596, partial [Clavulina sp. PMI_390]
PHEYCCCAIPLQNYGIYIVILEQLTVSMVAGTFALTTPKLVGADLPSFAPWIFAAICYVTAVIQLVGFLAVKNENSGLYRTYTRVNSIAISAVFGVGAAFIGIAWAHHSTSVSDCITEYFTAGGQTENDNKSQTMCKIFAYANEGILTGLWALLLFVQLYFVLVTRFYAKAQSESHEKYFSYYGASAPDDIMLDERPAGDAWDHR